MDLSDRSRAILKAIINSYIATAEPVGSRTVTKRYDIGLSPATVRNIMADLEELGFLAQPHTSAGRVPTDKAYRFYIDMLLEVGALPRQEEERILAYPLPREGLHQLLQETTRLLSALSHYAGVVTAPKPAETVYTQIEFLRLSGRRALAIFVSEAGVVHNRIVPLDEETTQAEFDRFSAFINREMSGRTLRQMRERLVAMMDEERSKYVRMLVRLMDAWRDTVVGEEAEEGELFVGGLAEFFGMPDFRDSERMRELFRAFEEKHRLVRLLDIAAEAEGVQVFIGSENPYFDMEGISLVVSSYRSAGNVMGTLGVIGPSRMPYSTVIPLVDCTAKIVSRIINER